MLRFGSYVGAALNYKAHNFNLYFEKTASDSKLFIVKLSRRIILKVERKIITYNCCQSLVNSQKSIEHKQLITVNTMFSLCIQNS